METSTAQKQKITRTRCANDEERKARRYASIARYQSKPEIVPIVREHVRKSLAKRYNNDIEYKTKKREEALQRYYEKKILKMYQDMWL